MWLKQKGNACLCICEKEEGMEMELKAFNPMSCLMSFILEKNCL